MPPQQDFISKRKWKKKRHKESIVLLDSALAVLFFRLPRLTSVLLGTLGVVLDEQAEGGEAKQKGLDKPQAARGHVVNTFVTAGTERRNDEQKSG